MVLAAAFGSLAVGEHVPLSSSVLLLDARRLENAEAYIDRAAKLGGGRVQLVVTLHAQLSSNLRIEQLGLLRDRRRSWKDPRNFWPLDQSLSDYIQQQLNKAVARAVYHNLDIAILSHLDPAGEIEEWRNYYQFHPHEPVAGRSYHDSLIEPVIRALKREASPNTHIWFALAGEMGRSLFQHPEAYREMLRHVRHELPRPNVKVGISLNHNELGGGHQPTAVQHEQLQLLLNECQFVGFSNYRPFTLPVSEATFAAALHAFLAELGRRDLTLPSDTPLHFSEIGLGGAPHPSGNVSPARAARQPWEGASLASTNPWRPPLMRRFRRQYYAALLEYLAKERQPTVRKPTAAFLWNEGSWAPLGIDQPRLADPSIVTQVRQHNDASDSPSYRIR